MLAPAGLLLLSGIGIPGNGSMHMGMLHERDKYPDTPYVRFTADTLGIGVRRAEPTGLRTPVLSRWSWRRLRLGINVLAMVLE